MKNSFRRATIISLLLIFTTLCSHNSQTWSWYNGGMAWFDFIDPVYNCIRCTTCKLNDRSVVNIGQGKSGFRPKLIHLTDLVFHRVVTMKIKPLDSYRVTLDLLTALWDLWYITSFRVPIYSPESLGRLLCLLGALSVWQNLFSDNGQLFGVLHGQVRHTFGKLGIFDLVVFRTFQTTLTNLCSTGTGIRAPWRMFCMDGWNQFRKEIHTLLIHYGFAQLSYLA